ncbi:Piwi-domain-containing protein [Pisolithus croceorrhizus]|nr:Piwi-domain-containing protein [Pisolithus croceorrhizus]
MSSRGRGIPRGGPRGGGFTGNRGGGGGGPTGNRGGGGGGGFTGNRGGGAGAGFTGNRGGGGGGSSTGNRGGGGGFTGNRGGPPDRGGPRGGYAYSGGGQQRGRGGGPTGAGASGDRIFGSPAPVDQRLQSSDSLVQVLKKLPYKPERPHRPGFGTLGTPITVRANFFAVKFEKQFIYDYAVEISPDKFLKKKRARLFTLLEQSEHPQWRELAPYIAHDGSAKLSLEVPIVFREEDETRSSPSEDTYKFTFELKHKLDIQQLNSFLNGETSHRDYDFSLVVAAYNLVLQSHAAHNGVRVKSGRDGGGSRYFFSPSPGERFDLSSPGVVAWKGFFMSARPVYKQLMVNIGVCMTPFYESGSLADAILQFQGRSQGAVPQRFAQRLKVTTAHLGYKSTKVLHKITGKSARDTFFSCDEFKNPKMSVEDYFKRKYNIKLKHANDLPVVDLAGKNAKHPIYVPAELCQIATNQPFRGKLNDIETQKMIRHACNPPADNARAITGRGLASLGLSQTNNTVLHNFGIEIDHDMTVIPARELPPPKVNYAAGRPPNVKDGSWNILDVTFHQGATVKSWCVLVVWDGRQPAFGGNPNDQGLTSIWKGFAKKCQRSGMKVEKDPKVVFTPQLPPQARDPNRQGALNMIRQTIVDNNDKNHKPSFILVLLSGRDNFIYPGIKRMCDVVLGLHTLHMLIEKVLKDERKQDQYFSNVALKLNVKLGGINHILDAASTKWLTQKKTMVVGMDVTHPSPGSLAGTPSIAAVVASVDDKFVQFPASLRCQKSKKEMITEVDKMMIERLQRYREVNKVLPDRVFVYRDGVSEGQFDSVLEEELPAIRDAFRRMGSGGKSYDPALTIIICGKRHHVKLFPDRPEYADRNGNTRPGTVVDKGITSIFDFDFYLQAHAGLQGHVKGTHYTVVYDRNKLGADEIQQGLNTASYLYARATKAVSLVPAAYYADLACERGRYYLSQFLNADEKSSTLISKGNSKQAKEEAEAKVFNEALKVWGQGVHADLKNSMFYI